MQRTSGLLTRIKTITDLITISLIVIITQTSLKDGSEEIFSGASLVVLFVNLTCWFFSARTLGLYKDYRAKPFSYEWISFLKALVLHTLLVSFILFQILDLYSFSTVYMWVHCTSIFFVLPVQKLMIRIIMKKISNSDTNKRKVLIVGAGNTGINFYQQYVCNEHYGYQLTGFLDDESKPALNGHYLGRTSDLDKVIAQHELDDIVVTLTNEKQIERVISIGEKQGKRIRIIPDYQRFGTGKLQVDKIGSLPIITLRSLPLDVADNKFYKRLFDICFSLLVIVCVFSWLFPIISIIIKLGSKGPVFFKQERWGLNNKVITCYKFRSMVVNSRDVDESGKYLQAQRNDPRITPIGKFLRKTNLDELPQFFNVLLGSMSVVGPRPHPVPLNIVSKDSIENYMMRHWVKPGITGWAQVNGYRGETRVPHLMEKRVQHDVWYIENWTFWLDLQIILQTLVNMVKGDKNAF